jgi:hypothetical protein
LPCLWWPAKHLFEVRPQILCEGETAAIHWAAAGELALAFRSEPHQNTEPECAAEVFEIFTLTLVARKKGEETERKVEIGQLQRPAAESIVFNANAIVGTDVGARGEKNPGLWSDRVEVITVAARRRRAYGPLPREASGCQLKDLWVG